MQIEKQNKPYYRSEISFSEMINFIKDNRKKIFLCGLLGLTASIIFVFTVKSQYQTTAQILIQNNSISSTQFSYVNYLNSILPSPNLVIEQLKQPGVYSDETVEKCAVTEDNPKEVLANTIVKSANLKKIDNALQISIKRESIELAKICTLAVFQDIIKMQSLAVNSASSELNTLLDRLKSRFAENETFIHNLNKSDIQSAVYLSKKDESNYLREQILNLEQSLKVDLKPKMLSIYTPSKPVYPRRTLVLVMGFLIGLLAGLLYSISREVAKNMRLNATS